MELLNGGVVKAGTPVQDIKFMAANMQRKCARGKTAKTLLVQEHLRVKNWNCAR
jgi:hypothetical protein